MLEPAALAGSGLVLSRCIVQRTMSTHYTVHTYLREKRERVVLYFRGYIVTGKEVNTLGWKERPEAV
jgi:hypothetical protein